MTFILKIFSLVFFISSFFYSSDNYLLKIGKNNWKFCLYDSGKKKYINLNFYQQEKIIDFLEKNVIKISDEIYKRFDCKKNKFYFSTKSGENIYVNFKKFKNNHDDDEKSIKLKIFEIYKTVYDWGILKKNLFLKNEENFTCSKGELNLSLTFKK